MVDTSALEAGTIIAGRYRVASKIGHGGMGAVYLVHHVHTDESLALKVVHAQVLRDAAAIERFRREARAPAKITSEHVARVTDADTAADLDGAPFYVMEYLRGRDLERILAEEGPLPPPLVAEYLRQMARALDKAHAIGIVHRDLKPENLFLTHREDGSPCIKLLDFGIARLGDVVEPKHVQAEGGAPTQAGLAPMVTQVGYVFGTPNYMAPEQTIGETDKIGPATDIWAIGLVAFKLLVGKEFFTGENSTQLYAQILAHPIPTPTERGSTHGPAFDAWFARCVARLVPDRFTSAGEAVSALALALGVHLPERQQSSADFPPSMRFSQPSITGPALTGPISSGGVSTSVILPTTLPAGVPAAGSNRKALAIVAALVALAAVVSTLLYVLVVRRPARATTSGLVAASAPPPPASQDAPGSQSSHGGQSAPPPPASVAHHVATSTPAATGASHGRGAAKTATTAAPAAPTNNAKDEPVLTREQRKRLESLDRLCAQGTFKPAECQTKRQAILHGGT